MESVPGSGSDRVLSIQVQNGYAPTLVTPCSAATRSLPLPVLTSLPDACI